MDIFFENGAGFLDELLGLGEAGGDVVAGFLAPDRCGKVFSLALSWPLIAPPGQLRNF